MIILIGNIHKDNKTDIQESTRNIKEIFVPVGGIVCSDYFMLFWFALLCCALTW